MYCTTLKVSADDFMRTLLFLKFQLSRTAKSCYSVKGRQNTYLFLLWQCFHHRIKNHSVYQKNLQRAPIHPLAQRMTYTYVEYFWTCLLKLIVYSFLCTISCFSSVIYLGLTEKLINRLQCVSMENSVSGIKRLPHPIYLDLKMSFPEQSSSLCD